MIVNVFIPTSYVDVSTSSKGVNEFTCQGWRDVRVTGGHREVAMGQAAVWITGLDRAHINCGIISLILRFSVQF